MESVIRRRPGSQSRIPWPALLLVAILAWYTAGAAAAGAAGAATLYDLADQSTLISWAKVTKISTYADGRFVVYRLALDRVYKGEGGLGSAELVQDRRPGKVDALLLKKDQRLLLFAINLPSYSLYRKALPGGSYWQWAESYPAQARIRKLAEEEAGRAVQGYLASAGNGVEGQVSFVASRLNSPLGWLRDDSISWLGKREDLAAMLTGEAFAEVSRCLSGTEVPARQRARLIDVLARHEVVAAVPTLAALVQDSSAVAGAAIKALARLGHAPAVDSLIEYSRSTDPALRAGAAYALARNGAGKALKRVEELVLGDPEEEVRLAGIKGLAFAGKGVGILDKAVTAGDRRIKLEAGESLLRIRSDQAFAVLKRQLYSKDDVAGTVAVFTLAKWKSEEAFRVLAEALESPSISESVKGAIRSLQRKLPARQ